MTENASATPPRGLRLDLARELIARAANADAYWTRLVRGQLTDGEVGRGRLTDYTNGDYLRRITDTHGWPGRGLVGDEGASAAWRIALRADNQPPFQRHAERLMYRAVQLGEASVRQWAHLYDRIRLQYGAAQEFGTQYRNGPKGLEREPVNDAANLDLRRREAGLPPAEESLERLRRRLSSEPDYRPEAAADAPTLKFVGVT
ncbi:DUF6624 domain-containing protein [Streptomyces sp. Qhu_M48]|uniref:DUF6624 domain-containing protein n=1 Tax=Streptomyces sp. Qhu_M48 TaxID=3435889 RepID=UPI003F500ED5